MYYFCRIISSYGLSTDSGKYLSDYTLISAKKNHNLNKFVYVCINACNNGKPRARNTSQETEMQMVGVADSLAIPPLCLALCAALFASRTELCGG